MTGVLGFDPGRTGAMVLLDEESGGLLEASRMPFSKGKADRESLVKLIGYWAATHEIVDVAIELVHSRPGNGVKQAFAFGMYSEMARMSVVAAELEYREVVPQTWQRIVGLLPKMDGQDPKIRRKEVKAALVRRAMEWWPELPILLVADQGMADAALIAEWARRNPPE